MKRIILVILISMIPLKAFAATEVYFTPEDRCDEIVIEHIKSATKSIDIAMYSFTNEDISDALINAAGKGIMVRVLMDRTQAGEKNSRDVILEESGMYVMRNAHAGIMHNKYAIIDKKTVLTGSYGWDIEPATKSNDNLVILDEAIEEYYNNFEELWTYSAGRFVYYYQLASDMKNRKRV